MSHYLNFIGQTFVDTPNGHRFAVTNPATGLPGASVIEASEQQVLEAVDKAHAAQRSWKKTPSAQRAVHMEALAQLLVQRAGLIGHALALESGKSLEDATNETIYAAEILRFHAQWARRVEGEIIPSDSPNENLLLYREPMGVVACLIPFNYPVYTLLRKIAPALITGNAVLVRPSNNTPTSALEIARCVQDSGFPSDLIQIMVMSHASAECMCTHPKVAMITLTGSVQAGQKVIGYSRANIAKVSLELGGKTPVIVEPDADLDAVALAIVNAKLTHCGQLCTAPERVYAHASIHDALVDKLHAAMLAKTHGDRAANANFVGPLVSATARASIHAMVQRAVAAGAHLLCGGAIPEGPGYFYPPTLLTHCDQSAEIVQEEVFGPVLPVLRYAHLDQALEWANDHQFGLSSVLFTSDLRKAMQVANRIESGELYINRMPADPFQGYHAGWKRSGLGGDDGKHGMLEFTQTRLVVVKY